MRFPNIFQTALMIVMLILMHWFLNRHVDWPDNTNLADLVISLLKIGILILLMIPFLKNGRIDKSDVKLKKANPFFLLISAIISILLVFNPLMGSFSFYKEEDVLNIIDTIINTRTDIFLFLNIVIAVPIFEELMFRGIILSGLKSNHNAPVALIISSLLFGILHVDIVGSTVLGLWLGWVYLKTNNITLCIIAHAACNLFTFIFRIVIKTDSEQNFINFILEHSFIMSIVMFLGAFGILLASFKKFESVNRA